MKIGMVTDSLGSLGFEEVLDAAKTLGLDCVEFATGNWSTAPHIDIDALLRSKPARDRFTRAVADRGLSISASLGVATYPDNGTTAADILLAADRACQVSKRTGRARTSTATDGLALAQEFTLSEPTPVDDRYHA